MDIDKKEDLDLLTESRFNKLLIKFLLDEPFFSTIIRHMRKIRTDRIPTAGVTFKDDSICLYWNPAFIAKLTRKQVFGLLKHECYHLIFKHLTTRKQEPHLMWNIATDLAINSTIPMDELPEGGLIPGEFPKNTPTNLPKDIQEKSQKMAAFIASLPKNKASEWYMDKLRENPEMQEIIEELMGQKGCEGQCPGGIGGDGDKPGNGGTGTCAGFDYHFDDDMSDANKAMADAKVEQIVKNAASRAQSSNGWGSTPTEMRKAIMALLEKSVDWKAVLSYFCGTKQRANKTRTMRRINRKYPYIHSGRKIKHTSNLAIYIDQSGSVGDDDITIFFGALNTLAKNVTFTVYHFDCTVDEDSRYVWKKRSPNRNPQRTRSGGTNFESVETHFRKVSSEFDGYIVMTDGEAPRPRSCISKRCWVLCPGRQLMFQHDKRDTVVSMKV